jgi:hypothetical protein
MDNKNDDLKIEHQGKYYWFVRAVRKGIIVENERGCLQFLATCKPEAIKA